MEDAVVGGGAPAIIGICKCQDTTSCHIVQPISDCSITPIQKSWALLAQDSVWWCKRLPYGLQWENKMKFPPEGYVAAFHCLDYRVEDLIFLN